MWPLMTFPVITKFYENLVLHNVSIKYKVLIILDLGYLQWPQRAYLISRKNASSQCYHSYKFNESQFINDGALSQIIFYKM